MIKNSSLRQYALSISDFKWRLQCNKCPLKVRKECSFFTGNSVKERAEIRSTVDSAESRRLFINTKHTRVVNACVRAKAKYLLELVHTEKGLRID